MHSLPTIRSKTVPQIRRIASLQLVLPLLLMLAGCSDDLLGTSPDEPLTLVLVSGDQQTGLPDNDLADTLRVKLTDGSGNPVAGQRIAWTADSGSLTPSTSQTDAEGIAWARWTLGDRNPQTATARVVGASAEPVEFVAHLQEIWRILVSPDTIMVEGTDRTLTAEARAPNRNGLLGGIVETEFEWSSSDPRVATVDSAGRVYAFRAGVTRITAEAAGVRGWTELNVVLEAFRPRQFAIRDWLNCGVLDDGSPYCFGGGGGGVFGYEPLEYHWPDYAAPAYPGYRFEEMAVTDATSCGRTEGGQVFCSGRNMWGSLGAGAGIASTSTPLPVGGGIQFSRLYGGRHHFCGLSLDGSAYCWGSNPNGQIGDGTHTEKYVPTRVEGGLRFTELSIGNRTTCGLTEGGELYCWGLLGFLRGDPASYVPIGVEVGEALASVSVGEDSICGITPAARLLCWGNNDLGQIGDGSTDFAGSPRQIPGNYKNVAVGFKYACAVDVNGGGWCWGRNTVGQLGNGIFDGVSRTGAAHPNPTRIELDVPLESISVANAKSCALSEPGLAYCWGLGSLGNGEGMTDCSIQWPADWGSCRAYPKPVL